PIKFTSGSIRARGTVNTKHRAERTELKPAGKELLKLRVFSIAIARFTIAEKATRIRVPIRNTGQGEIQTGGNLVFEYGPFSLNVARPGDGTVTLLTGIRRTSQDDDPFPVGSSALP